MDHGLLSGAVFLDLHKAFYSVDHEILISKLELYGLKNIELEWFGNYLKDHKQLVTFGKEISDSCPMTSGVSQGSILGLLLFVLFINDMPIVQDQCQILMYADNTVIYYPTLLRGVQIMHEMSRNIARYLYLSHSPDRAKDKKPWQVRILGKRKRWIINLLLDILVCSITVNFYSSFVF